MEDLIQQVKLAKTRVQRQELAAAIISVFPQFIKELGELEQKYNILFRQCIQSEGTKAGAELVIGESDLHKEYIYKKRMHDAVKQVLTVLNMYTG